MQLDVLYADDDVVVVDKPSGLPVHRGWARDPVVAMTVLRDQLGAWVYPVHRLDRSASGALLFALSSEIAAQVQVGFANGSVEKRYGALVRGVPKPQGIIDHPLRQSPDKPRVPATTRYQVVQQFARYAWVECWTQSGRRHQVRRHFKHISCPLIGDVRYGKGPHNRLFREQYALHRLALHAQELSFFHPRSGERITTLAPLPDCLKNALTALGQTL